jgi:hypothetical protein
VTITIGSGDGSSWAATASHGSTTKTCSIASGGTADGVPTCN